jgi:uncharacterized Rossmann fold enzyme
MTEYKPAWEATWEGFAEVLAADRDARLRKERTDRAKTDLSDPPKARSHAERMAAAQGVHVHGDNMRILAGERRRIVKHRGDE